MSRKSAEMDLRNSRKVASPEQGYYESLLLRELVHVVMTSAEDFILTVSVPHNEYSINTSDIFIIFVSSITNFNVLLRALGAPHYLKEALFYQCT